MFRPAWDFDVVHFYVPYAAHPRTSIIRKRSIVAKTLKSIARNEFHCSEKRMLICFTYTIIHCNVEMVSFDVPIPQNIPPNAMMHIHKPVLRVPPIRHARTPCLNHAMQLMGNVTAMPQPYVLIANPGMKDAVFFPYHAYKKTPTHLSLLFTSLEQSSTLHLRILVFLLVAFSTSGKFTSGWCLAACVRS